MKRMIVLVMPLVLACSLLDAQRGATVPAVIQPPEVESAAVMYTPPSPTLTLGASCEVTADSLNMRTAPEGQAQSSVLNWLSRGQIVNVLETRGAWLYIRANDMTGYIHSNYCEPRKDAGKGK